jgi:hypothetical protein
MSKTDEAYLEAMNCFSFANQIWASGQKDRFNDAEKAYSKGLKIYQENFVEKKICEDDDFEF